MTFYELSAVDASGRSFTLATTRAQHLALADALLHALMQTDDGATVVEYEAFPLSGELLADVLLHQFEALGSTSLHWHRDSQRWETPLDAPATDSIRAHSWSVVWGSY